MQVLLNCHQAALLQSFQILKKQLNDNLITLACVIALVHYSYLAMYIYGTAQFKLDIYMCGALELFPKVTHEHMIQYHNLILDRYK